MIYCRVQVEKVLLELKSKERNKKKKEKLANLFLSEDEVEKLKDIVKALGIVKSGSQRLCGNNVTLSAADRVGPIHGKV